MFAKFEAYFDSEYWCARGIGADVFTQGRTLDELMWNIQGAAALHFGDDLAPGECLHLLILSEMEVADVAPVAAG